MISRSISAQQPRPSHIKDKSSFVDVAKVRNFDGSPVLNGNRGRDDLQWNSGYVQNLFTGQSEQPGIYRTCSQGRVNSLVSTELVHRAE